MQRRIRNIGRAVIVLVAFPYLCTLYMRALSAEARCDWEKAIVLGRRLMRFITTPDMLTRMAHAHSQLGRWQEAFSLLTQIDLSGESTAFRTRYYLNCAVALEHLGRKEEAVELLENQINDRWPAGDLRKAREIIDS